MPEKPETSTGAKSLLKELKRQGVKRFFGYPGGVLLGLYDELYGEDELMHILVRHEQGGVHAAEGYAKVAGRPGVVLATSGPGATNLVTGIADAYMDSVPIICLTGQVPTFGIGTDFFQEADITGITYPIVKHSYLVKKPENLAKAVANAFHICQTGRPGPVLIDIPMDVQKYDISNVNIPNQNSSINKFTNTNIFKNLIDDLNNSKKPLILVGGGIRTSNSSESFRNFLNTSVSPFLSELTHSLSRYGAFENGLNVYIKFIFKI